MQDISHLFVDDLLSSSILFSDNFGSPTRSLMSTAPAMNTADSVEECTSSDVNMNTADSFYPVQQSFDIPYMDPLANFSAGFPDYNSYQPFVPAFPYFGVNNPKAPIPQAPSQRHSIAKRPSLDSQDSEFICLVSGCNKKFQKAFNLKSHLKSHDEGRTFSCQLCNTTFRRSHDLKRHLRSLHSGVKAHACDVCGKRFARTDALRRHISRPNSACYKKL